MAELSSKVREDRIASHHVEHIFLRASHTKPLTQLHDHYLVCHTCSGEICTVYCTVPGCNPVLDIIGLNKEPRGGFVGGIMGGAMPPVPLPPWDVEKRMLPLPLAGAGKEPNPGGMAGCCRGLYELL
jgi:hypothetical protein